jgi:magnesium-transporting ATPase (P-type)
MPESLIPHCTFYLDKNGEKTALQPKDRKNYEKMSQKMSERGLRPILLAYTQLRESQVPIYESKAKT